MPAAKRQKQRYRTHRIEPLQGWRLLTMHDADRRPANG